MSSERRQPVFDKQASDDLIARTLSHQGETDALEVAFSGLEAATMRLAESQIVQAGRATVGRVSVRAARAGGLGISTTSDLSDAGLAACVRDADAQAAASTAVASDPADAALASPGPARPAPTWALDPDAGWLDGETKGPSRNRWAR